MLGCRRTQRLLAGAFVREMGIPDAVETLRGKETKVLEQKCANGAPPTAAAEPTAGPAKHAGHRHGPRRPSLGGHESAIDRHRGGVVGRDFA
jgi:hypothetical protein